MVSTEVPFLVADKDTKGVKIPDKISADRRKHDKPDPKTNRKHEKADMLQAYSTVPGT